MQKNLITLAIFGAVCFVMPAFAFALGVFDIQFPIASLGNCANQQECKAFCDNSANQVACTKWSQDNGFAPKPAAQQPQQATNAIKTKPTQQATAQQTPNQPQQQSKPQIDQKKSQEIISTKGGPGGCKTQQECSNYCSVLDHQQECSNFVTDNNLLSAQDMQAVKKQAAMVKKISTEGGPGGCKSQEDCKTFCNEPNNIETCVAFSQSNGMMTADQSTQILQQVSQMKQQMQQQPQQQSMPQKNCQGGSCGPGGQSGKTPQGQGGNIPPSNNGGQGQNVGNNNPNPTKCIDDCELTGKNCIAALDAQTKACNTEGQNCRNVTCNTAGGEGGQTTADQFHQCNDTICTPNETKCHDAVTIKNSACTTAKDQCVSQCQKSSRPTDINSAIKQQGTAGGPNQGQGFNPGSGVNGNGPGKGQRRQMMPPQTGQGNSPMPQQGTSGGVQTQPYRQPPQPPQQPEAPISSIIKSMLAGAIAFLTGK